MVERLENSPGVSPEPTPVAPSRRARWSWIGGSTVVVVALGALASTMAIPKRVSRPDTLAGPFVAKLSKHEIEVNLAGEGGKRYLSMALNAEFHAYDEAYVSERLGGTATKDARADRPPDPLYVAMLQDALLALAATRTRDEVTDPVHIEAFLEDVRRAVDPILFPVCVGDSRSPGTPDPRSGLRVGESNARATMRGLLGEHRVHVDARRKTLRLDDGPTVAFQGDERDLALDDERRGRVWIDVTTLDPDFQGAVPCGVAGKVLRIYRERFLVQ